MNLNIKKILGLALLLICTSCGFIHERNDLSTLLEDMKNYRTTSAHRGDLWQHSVWTGQILGRWVRGMEQETFCEMITKLIQPLLPRECYLLEVAGVVHDIGKAGDLDIQKYEKTKRDGDIIYYFSRENHERIGFEYIVHDLPSMKNKFARSYRTVDGNAVNFYLLFSKLGITEEEQKLIAILVGAHKSLYLSLFKPLEKASDFVINQINDLAKEVNYNSRSMISLLCMSILLQLADTKATYFPVTTKGPSSLFEADLIVPSPHLHSEDDDQSLKMLAQFMPHAEKLIYRILACCEKSSSTH